MSIQPYGLLISISFILAFYFFQRNTTLDKKHHENLFLGITIFSILGARLYHVLHFFSFYSQNPTEIYKLWHGGLGIYGGIFGSFVFILFYCKKNKINIVSFLDSIVAPLALGQAIGRWGNYFNQEIYGNRGEPLWLWESIACFFIFLVLKKAKKPLATYLLLYGIFRFFVEFYRTDTWQIYDTKVSQIVSLGLVFLGLFFYTNKWHPKHFK